MFEPNLEQKIQFITEHVVHSGTCVSLGGPTSETTFTMDGTEVRFMRDGHRYTTIALENEDRNIFVYWSEGFDPQFMMTEDGQEFQILWLEIYDQSGIMF